MLGKFSIIGLASNKVVNQWEIYSLTVVVKLDLLTVENLTFTQITISESLSRNRYNVNRDRNTRNVHFQKFQIQKNSVSMDFLSNRFVLLWFS